MRGLNSISPKWHLENRRQNLGSPKRVLKNSCDDTILKIFFKSYLSEQSAPKCVSRSHDATWLLYLASPLVDWPWLTPPTPRELSEMATLRSLPLPLRAHRAKNSRGQDALVGAGGASVLQSFSNVSTPAASSRARPPSAKSAPGAFYTAVCHCSSPNCRSNIHFCICDHHLWCLPLSLIIFFPLFLLFLVSSWPFPKHLFYASGVSCQKSWVIPISTKSSFCLMRTFINSETF